MRSGLRLHAFAVAIGLALPAGAQVTNDGTLGTNGPGLVGNAPNGSGGLDYFLTEADGERHGANLFHSLGRMDLGQSDAAVYQGDASIDNLITRITGGASSIDGQIRSEIPGANLFLVNPDGIVFGEHASLNVSGDTVISTAHEVLLGSSGRFDTRAAGGDILTVDPPSAFGFVSPPAPIVVRGSQIVGADNHSVSLIGGDLLLSGTRSDDEPGLLSAPGGRIDLASVRSSGTVRIVGGAEPDLLLEDVATRGDVILTDDFIVSSSGVRRNPLDPNVSPARGSGPIFVRGANLTVDNSEIRVLTVTNQAAGDVSIDLTGDLIVRGTPEMRALINAGSGLTIPVPPNQTPTQVVRRVDPSIGLVRDFFVCQGAVCGVAYLTPAAAGDIAISARNVSLERGQLVSRSEFTANAGEITLDLEGDLTIRGASADGNRSGVLSNAVGSGNQGRIHIQMEDGLLRMEDLGQILIENGAQSPTTGTAGRIEIHADALEMSGNARIDSSTRGAGDGGSLTLMIDGHARLRGTSDPVEFTGISTLSQPGSTGDAGKITLSAGSLEIRDGAQISARPVGTGALGDSGNIDITVADDLVMRRGGKISTQSDAAGGGNIDVAIGGIADLRDSAITSSVTTGDSPGGIVTLAPRSTAVVLQNSQVVARADLGQGGDVVISTNALIQDVDSLISASSNANLDGTVDLDSPDAINVQQTELLVPPIDVSSLLREACALRDPGAASTFVVEPDPGPRRLDGDILPAFVSGALPPDDGASLGGAAAPASICRR